MYIDKYYYNTLSPSLVTIMDSTCAIVTVPHVSMADVSSLVEARVEVVCLACGSTISEVTERTKICNTSSEVIISLWKSYLKWELERKNQLSVYESAFTDHGEVKTTNKGIQKNIVENAFIYLKNF